MESEYDSDFLVKRGDRYEKYNFSTTAEQVACQGKNGENENVQDAIDGLRENMDSVSADAVKFTNTDGTETTLQDKLNYALGNNRLEFKAIMYTSETSTTMTKLFVELSAPCMCITSTENVSDKPANKYGTIVIYKFSDTRAGADCYCTDGTVLHNIWNASTSAVTGWE